MSLHPSDVSIAWNTIPTPIHVLCLPPFCYVPCSVSVLMLVELPSLLHHIHSIEGESHLNNSIKDIRNNGFCVLN